MTYYNLSAQKNLGQHFLIDKTVLQNTLEAAELSLNDFVVEVGPGFGILTLPMCDEAGRVLAIETDPKMIDILKTLGSSKTNLDVTHQNILRTSSEEFYEAYKLWSTKRTSVSHYKVVSNLPYYITSAIIKLFMEARHRPEVMVLMVQKEVAERIAAKAGDMSMLGLSVQLYGAPEVVSLVPKTAFWPQPQVESAILKIKVYKKIPYAVDDIKTFFRIAKAGFSEKRKQLHNSLSGGLQLDLDVVKKTLEGIGIESTTRPEDLGMEEWVKVYTAFKGLI